MLSLFPSLLKKIVSISLLHPYLHYSFGKIIYKYLQQRTRISSNNNAVILSPKKNRLSISLNFIHLLYTEDS